MLRLALAIYAFAHGMHAEPVTLSRVIDGDTLDVIRDGETVRVRLAGVEAGNPRSSCDVERTAAKASTAALKELVTGAALALDDTGQRSWGRVVGHVYADGVPIADVLIDAGHLRPWPHDENNRPVPGHLRPNWCLRSPVPVAKPERN